MEIQNENDKSLEPEYRVNTGWDPLKFFIYLVVVEHTLLILKLMLEYAIDDVPADLQIFEMDR